MRRKSSDYYNFRMVATGVLRPFLAGTTHTYGTHPSFTIHMNILTQLLAPKIGKNQR